MLNTAPFLNVQSERNNGVFYPQTRGGEQLNLQFDGIPGPGNLGYQDALPLDTAIFDRVEVLYGAQGLLAGFGNAGGVINMVRKMPTRDFQASGEATVDTDGGFRLVGDVSGPLNQAGSLRGRFVAVYDYDQSFIDYAWTRWPTALRRRRGRRERHHHGRGRGDVDRVHLVDGLGLRHADAA